jgi:hypothetical protein
MTTDREIIEAKLREYFPSSSPSHRERAGDSLHAALLESRKADIEAVRKVMRAIHPGIVDRAERDSALAALSRLAGDE